MNAIDTLSVVLSKLQQNFKNVRTAQSQSRAAMADMDPAVREAAQLLVTTFKHPEGVMSIIKTVAQSEALNETETELEVMIAAMQVQIGEGDMSKVTSQITANNEVIDSPLPVAGASSELTPANQAALDEICALAAAADNTSDSVAEVAKGLGDTAA